MTNLAGKDTSKYLRPVPDSSPFSFRKTKHNIRGRGCMKLQWDTELQGYASGEMERQPFEGKGSCTRMCFHCKKALVLDQEGNPVKQPVETWSEDEKKSLVEFVLFHTTSDHWPCYPRCSKFWTQASECASEKQGFSLEIW